MSKSSKSVSVGRGRPVKYNTAGYIQAFKNVVRKHGLIAGREFLNANGVTVGGKHREVSVSLPTLSKLVKRTEGGAVVELHRGRPAKVA